MKCPLCNNEIEVTKNDISHNTEPQKEYDHTVYFCKTDNVWITTEVPRVSE